LIAGLFHSSPARIISDENPAYNYPGTSLAANNS
jgi:hypothetical protein